MAPPIKTHCKRGHPLNPLTSRLVKLQTGYTVRQCKRCRSLCDSERYKNNPTRREKLIAKARARYHVEKALKEFIDVDTVAP